MLFIHNYANCYTRLDTRNQCFFFKFFNLNFVLIKLDLIKVLLYPIPSLQCSSVPVSYVLSFYSYICTDIFQVCWGYIRTRSSPFHILFNFPTLLIWPPTVNCKNVLMCVKIGIYPQAYAW